MNKTYTEKERKRTTVMNIAYGCNNTTNCWKFSTLCSSEIILQIDCQSYNHNSGSTFLTHGVNAKRNVASRFCQAGYRPESH